jgi:hypothetical protein
VVAGDFSSDLAADTLNGIYIGLADDPTATTKVAKRRITIGVDARWFGAKGDGATNDTAAIQAAIDFSVGRTLLIPYGEYMCGELFITKAMTIKGESRPLNPNSYENTESRINFSFVAADNFGLTVGGGGATNQMVGFSMENLGFKGGFGIGGADFAGTITESVTDSQIVNCYWYTFKTGIKQSYLISAKFDNCRVQNCVNGIDSGNQCNANLYNKCSVVSISDRAIKFSNNEGVHFDSCNISNLTRATSPITTFQSSVIFTNGYFENVTSDSLIQVGSSSEAAGVESKVLFIHPLKLGGDVTVAKSGAFAKIIGGTRGTGRIVSSAPNVKIVNGIVEGENSKFSPVVYKELVKTGDLPFLLSYVGANITYSQHRGFYRINNTGGIASGGKISETLTPGELYTLTIAVRRVADNSLAIRNGSTLVVFGAVNAPAIPDVVSVSFIAEDVDIILQWSGDIDIYGYSLQEGNLRELNTTIFAVPETARNAFIGTGNIAPTAGSWKRGDIVYDANPNAGGSIGWTCTVSGTPGTWKTFGAIEA